MWSLVVTHVMVTLIEVLKVNHQGFKAQFEIPTWNTPYYTPFHLNPKKHDVFLGFGSSQLTLLRVLESFLWVSAFTWFVLCLLLSLSPRFARPDDPMIGTLHTRQLVTLSTVPVPPCSARPSHPGTAQVMEGNDSHAGYGGERPSVFSRKYQSLRLQNLKKLFEYSILLLAWDTLKVETRKRSRTSADHYEV